jgi:hypothetical protein
MLKRTARPSRSNDEDNDEQRHDAGAFDHTTVPKQRLDIFAGLFRVAAMILAIASLALFSWGLWEVLASVIGK